MAVKGPGKHFLRELSSLQQYPVIGSEGREGTLSGFVFDPSDWRIMQFIVNADHEPDSQCLLSVQEFRSIDDEAQRIEIEDSGRPLFMSRAEIENAVSEAGLACTRHLVDHEIQGLDTSAGRVVDLLVNIDVWELRYLVIATGTKSVLTDIEWCVSIDGHDASPHIDLPATAVAMAPSYRSLDELCIGYEEALYRHYTQRGYASNNSDLWQTLNSSGEV